MKLCQPVIPLIPEREFLSLSDYDQAMYLKLYREQVSPKFEEWRNPHRMKIAYGGRGAGAKSRSAGSLLVQFGENPDYFGESLRVLCVRDVQKSIKESSWRLLRDELDRLGYCDWEVQRDQIINKKNGAYFIFNGLNDLTSTDLKSYESFDILFAEEGAPISKAAWLSIQATFRKPTAEIWILFNRELNMDPCYELYCQNPDPSWSVIECKPGPEDNPWWFRTNLQDQWDRLLSIDPDEHAHQFLGLPRSQGDKAIFSRVDVNEMVDRELADEAGAEEIGCDVARYGKDSTVAFKRKGFRVTHRVSLRGAETVAVAGMLWDLADRDPKIPIKVDVGYNPGVVDVLSEWGANVIPVGFGETAQDEDQFTNAVSEMYFTLPVKDISIPEEYMTRELFEDLTERFYAYDSQGRKKIEPKEDSSTADGGAKKTNFKSRHGGRSPDDGDALALCFYNKSAAACF